MARAGAPPAILKHYPDLNNEQREIVAHLDGPLLVVAGPGSGKTYSIVLRALNLLLLEIAAAKEIVLCTFTEKAAFEMRDRLSAAAQMSVRSGPLKMPAPSHSTTADAFIKAHSSAWKNQKHVVQWKATIRTYVSPVFGSLPVQAVDVTLVMKVLEPIWITKPETAARIRGRIESVLNWAKAREYRTGENPAL